MSGPDATILERDTLAGTILPKCTLMQSLNFVETIEASRDEVLSPLEKQYMRREHANTQTGKWIALFERIHNTGIYTHPIYGPKLERDVRRIVAASCKPVDAAMSSIDPPARRCLVPGKPQSRPPPTGRALLMTMYGRDRLIEYFRSDAFAATGDERPKMTKTLMLNRTLATYFTGSIPSIPVCYQPMEGTLARSTLSCASEFADMLGCNTIFLSHGSHIGYLGRWWLVLTKGNAVTIDCAVPASVEYAMRKGFYVLALLSQLLISDIMISRCRTTDTVSVHTTPEQRYLKWTQSHSGRSDFTLSPEESTARYGREIAYIQACGTPYIVGGKFEKYPANTGADVFSRSAEILQALHERANAKFGNGKPYVPEGIVPFIEVNLNRDDRKYAYTHEASGGATPLYTSCCVEMLNLYVNMGDYGTNESMAHTRQNELMLDMLDEWFVFYCSNPILSGKGLLDALAPLRYCLGSIPRLVYGMPIGPLPIDSNWSGVLRTSKAEAVLKCEPTALRSVPYGLGRADMINTSFHDVINLCYELLTPELALITRALIDDLAFGVTPMYVGPEDTCYLRLICLFEGAGSQVGFNNSTQAATMMKRPSILSLLDAGQDVDGPRTLACDAFVRDFYARSVAHIAEVGYTPDTFMCDIKLSGTAGSSGGIKVKLPITKEDLAMGWADGKRIFKEDAHIGKADIILRSKGDVISVLANYILRPYEVIGTVNSITETPGMSRDELQRVEEACLQLCVASERSVALRVTRAICVTEFSIQAALKPLAIANSQTFRDLMREYLTEKSIVLDWGQVPSVQGQRGRIVSDAYQPIALTSGALDYGQVGYTYPTVYGPAQYHGSVCFCLDGTQYDSSVGPKYGRLAASVLDMKAMELGSADPLYTLCGGTPYYSVLAAIFRSFRGASFFFKSKFGHAPAARMYTDGNPSGVVITTDNNGIMNAGNWLACVDSVIKSFSPKVVLRALLIMGDDSFCTMTGFDRDSINECAEAMQAHFLQDGFQMNVPSVTGGMPVSGLSASYLAVLYVNGFWIPRTLSFHSEHPPTSGIDDYTWKDTACVYATRGGSASGAEFMCCVGLLGHAHSAAVFGHVPSIDPAALIVKAGCMIGTPAPNAQTWWRLRAHDLGLDRVVDVIPPPPVARDMGAAIMRSMGNREVTIKGAGPLTPIASTLPKLIAGASRTLLEPKRYAAFNDAAMIPNSSAQMAAAHVTETYLYCNYPTNSVKTRIGAAALKLPQVNAYASYHRMVEGGYMPRTTDDGPNFFSRPTTTHGKDSVISSEVIPDMPGHSLEYTRTLSEQYSIWMVGDSFAFCSTVSGVTTVIARYPPCYHPFALCPPTISIVCDLLGVDPMAGRDKVEARAAFRPHFRSDLDGEAVSGLIMRAPSALRRDVARAIGFTDDEWPKLERGLYTVWLSDLLGDLTVGEFSAVPVVTDCSIARILEWMPYLMADTASSSSIEMLDAIYKDDVGRVTRAIASSMVTIIACEINLYTRAWERDFSRDPARLCAKICSLPCVTLQVIRKSMNKS